MYVTFSDELLGVKLPYPSCVHSKLVVKSTSAERVVYASPWHKVTSSPAVTMGKGSNVSTRLFTIGSTPVQTVGVSGVMVIDSVTSPVSVDKGV